MLSFKILIHDRQDKYNKNSKTFFTETNKINDNIRVDSFILMKIVNSCFELLHKLLK